MLDLRPDYKWIKNQLADDYWTLSWLLLFRPEHPERTRAIVIQCADSSLILNPANIGVYTNVALALLLNGEYHKAETIYTKYRDSAYANGNNSYTKFKAAFDQDFNDLKKAGIIKGTDKALQNEIEYIRRQILKLE